MVQVIDIIFVGKLIHTPSLGTLEIEDATVGVHQDETIRFAKSHHMLKNAEVHVLKPLQFFFPGFIDTHIHAPQYPNAGFGIDLPLLKWLEKYTFPIESSFRNLDRALEIYYRVVTRTLSYGTTFASYFSSLHTPASALLAELCFSLGQRAYIGKCNMNTLSPAHYCEKSCKSSVEATNVLVSFMSQLDPNRKFVSPIITPRFAPSCTKDLLKACGELAANHDLPIQTHISENLGEIALVRELFPDRKSYTDVYDHHSLLTPKTVLAHAVYLEDEEIETIYKRQSGISHCPTSNAVLASGMANIRKLLDAGIKVSLGTDVSGGYTPNMLVAIRQAALTSRSLASVLRDSRIALELPELLYLATQGGAEVLGRGHEVGSFEEGKAWDALVVDVSSETNTPVDIYERDTWENILSKWVFNGDDRNVAQVWVNGKLIAGTECKIEDTSLLNLNLASIYMNTLTSPEKKSLRLQEILESFTKTITLPVTQCVSDGKVHAEPWKHSVEREDTIEPKSFERKQFLRST
ncbi:guanine deaminase [Schizosaccharomyces cryophilus OY26]|uniref:Guanine deaminase n=1 Tax=Schizosaccharomyces cryophilus (strain OY26 / ATCC MYA-4695 / CBS 11777 / NBRC 106824 / NRRL Y48691) TaxID=653667 RepID=S9VV30_SCHCR|nr:guanine deaminase [Schizosaccharomyces cryophilus OY26]EPY49920.1 guanine deaminase [Schizosaccharomyces cryophilus OY26]